MADLSPLCADLCEGKSFALQCDACPFDAALRALAESRAPGSASPPERAHTTHFDDCGCLSARLASAEARAEAAERERDEARSAKDAAYRERDRVVALAARMAAILHWPTWLGRHEDKPGDPPWDADWRNIVFIGLPSGQVSWHIHDSEVTLVRFLPSALSSVAKPWDGHDTAEKYRRCDGPWEIRDLHSDLSAARADASAAESSLSALREGVRKMERVLGGGDAGKGEG